MFRTHAGDGRLGFKAVSEDDLHALGAEHNVEIGQNGAFVDDHHAAADTFFHILPVFVRFHPAHANDRRLDGFKGLCRGGWQCAIFEGVQHRAVDVLLSDLTV